MGKLEFVLGTRLNETYTKVKMTGKKRLQKSVSSNVSFWLKHSVQFSRLVMYDSLQLHGLQHVRPPCPSQLQELTQTQLH